MQLHKNKKARPRIPGWKKVVALLEHRQNKNNVYRLKITKYETGANYTIIANVMGDTGNDSNGVVLIKKSLRGLQK